MSKRIGLLKTSDGCQNLAPCLLPIMGHVTRFPVLPCADFSSLGHPIVPLCSLLVGIAHLKQQVFTQGIANQL